MALSKTKVDKDAAIERLKGWLKDEDTLWFILRHRSASGMQRIYSVKQLKPELRPVAVFGKTHSERCVSASDLSSNIAMACGYSWSESWYGIKVNGCGFSGEQEVADTVGSMLGIKLRYESL